MNALAALLLACAPGAPERAERPLEPAIALGTGGTSFGELPEQGGTVELVAGPQGGWHVDVGLQAVDLDPEGATLSYVAVDDESGELVSYETTASLSLDHVLGDRHEWTRLGDRVVFDIRDPSEVVGRRVRLEVALVSDEVALDDARAPDVVDESR